MSCAACALLLTGMAAAQPPLPPPGVSSKCSAVLTSMASTSTAPAPAMPCGADEPNHTFCNTSITPVRDQCNYGMRPKACPPASMLPDWKFWVEHIPTEASLTKCIPNNSSNSPKPGEMCNSPCFGVPGDNNMDTGNYVFACTGIFGGEPAEPRPWKAHDMEKRIELVWGPEYTCKDGAGKPTPCLMRTEVIACMPADCTASDIALVGAMETKALCATLTPYNLSSCDVMYVSDGDDDM